MGKMDQVSITSWTTVSSESTPAHVPQHHDMHSFAPVYSLPPGSAKIADAATDPGKHRFDAMEIESSPSDQSWMNRIRWFRNTRTHRESLTPTRPSDDEIHYVGGKMEDATPLPTHPEQGSLHTHNFSKDSNKHTTMNTFERIASWMTANSSQHDEEDVADFHENEWTPPDSSYGAAIPLFGWIPKSTRRYIEFTIMLLMVLGLVYLVVMLSMMITEARREGVAEDNGLGLDDDRYIDFADDQVEEEPVDDDPYWTSSSSSSSSSSSPSSSNGYDGQRYRYFLR